MAFDLVVIGDTPAAYAAALAGGRLRRSVALIDPVIPGQQGTVVAAEYLHRLRDAYRDQFPTLQSTGANSRGQAFPILQLLNNQVVDLELNERNVYQQRLAKFGITQISGVIEIVDPHQIRVCRDDVTELIDAGTIVIATGTKSVVPIWARIDRHRVFCADDVLLQRSAPRSLLIIGASETGLEAAFLFSLLGSRVTLVDRRASLNLTPGATAASVLRQLHRLGVQFFAGAEAILAETVSTTSAQVELSSGERLSAERVLITTERNGCTSELNLAAIGVRLDEREKIWCNNQLQTWCPTIGAVGGVVGHPENAGCHPDAPRNLVWSLLSGIVPTQVALVSSE